MPAGLAREILHHDAREHDDLGVDAVEDGVVRQVEAVRDILRYPDFDCAVSAKKTNLSTMQGERNEGPVFIKGMMGQRRRKKGRGERGERGGAKGGR